MKLILLRHGIAEDPVAGMRDEERALTPRGVSRTRQAAAGLASILPPVDRVYSSTLRRARETAVIVTECCQLPAPEQCPELAPLSDPADVLDWLRARPPVGAVMLVGHEPHLGLLGGLLLCGRAAPLLRMKKAAAALIECSPGPVPGSGQLHWLLAPRQLRALASTDLSA